MTFDNPYCKKIRKSYLLLVSCGHCKEEFALYQKAGAGRLVRMYLSRIIRCAVDLTEQPETLFCPSCKKQLATKVILKRKDLIAYMLLRSSYNTKKI